MRIVNSIGKKGEDTACEFLIKNGFKVIERNFRRSYAEIDIVAVKDNILIFIEVKTRTSQEFGTPLESITYWKLKPLIKTAQYYALIHPELPETLRIDAIAIYMDTSDNIRSIEHIENISGF